MALAWTADMAIEAPTSPQPAESALIAASRSGDADAFSQLVRLHQRRVFRLVGRFFRRPEDVEDASQETFLTAWSKLGTYRAKAPFEHWLTRVCLNCCYARLRAGKRTAETSIEDRPEPAGRAGGDPDAALEVERLLRRLTPGDRFVLLLLYGEGWSVDEIARRLGWTAVNVKVRAHRARKKLRRFLEQEENR